MGSPADKDDFPAELHLELADIATLFRSLTHESHAELGLLQVFVEMLSRKDCHVEAVPDPFPFIDILESICQLIETSTYPRELLSVTTSFLIRNLLQRADAIRDNKDLK